MRQSEEKLLALTQAIASVISIRSDCSVENNEKILTYFSSFNLGDETIMGIIDNNGKVIVSSDKSKDDFIWNLLVEKLSENYFNKANKELLSKPELFSGTIGDNDNTKLFFIVPVLCSKEVDDNKTNLLFLSIVQSKKIAYSSAERLYKQIGLLLFLGCLAVGVLAFYFSSFITSPLSNLVDNVQKLQRGDYSVELPSKSKDELGELSRAFEQMVKAIHTKEIQMNVGLNELSIQHDFASTLNASLDFKERLTLTVKMVKKVLSAKNVSLFLLDQSTQRLLLKAKIDELDKVTLFSEDTNYVDEISNWVAKNRKSLTYKEGEFLPVKTDKIESALSVPLNYQDELIGVLTLVNRTINNPFDDTDAKFLCKLSNEIAIAIYNAKLYSEMKEKLDRFILAKTK